MLADFAGLGFPRGRECTKRIRAFEAAWARLQSDRPGWPQEQEDRRFHNALIAWLKFHRAMLIGELIPEALKFVRNNPAHPVLHGYDHVIVDEYQDLNRAEQILIDRLARHGCLAIVGDVDQSIYRFRHANPEGIVQFADNHPGTHDVPLIECRRCPTRVVEIADHLIRENHPPEIPNRLEPLPGNPPGDIRIVQWNSVDRELSGLATYVQYLVNERGYDPGDIIVLTPRRMFGYGIRDNLQKLGINAHSFYNEEPLEVEQAQEAFVLLTLLCNPEDRVALRWWLGFGSPTWRQGQYRRLRTYCEENDTSPADALAALVSGELLITGVTQLQHRFESLQDRLEPLRDLSCIDLFDDLFPDDEEWAGPMRGLAEDLLEKLEDEDDQEALLDSLKSNITQPEIPEHGDFVRVMSLHKSKGLTSRVVIVAGCIEGIIPSIDRDLRGAEREAAMNEQRRLFYVAITRCTETLVLSSVARMDATDAYRIGARLQAPRRRQGVWPTITSRFIGELGPTAPDTQTGPDWEQAGWQ